MREVSSHSNFQHPVIFRFLSRYHYLAIFVAMPSNMSLTERLFGAAFDWEVLEYSYDSTHGVAPLIGLFVVKARRLLSVLKQALPTNPFPVRLDDLGGTALQELVDYLRSIGIDSLLFVVAVLLFFVIRSYFRR